MVPTEAGAVGSEARLVAEVVRVEAKLVDLPAVDDPVVVRDLRRASVGSDQLALRGCSG